MRYQIAYSIFVTMLWFIVIGALAIFAVIKLKELILKIEFSKFKQLFREQRLSEIRQTTEIDIHGLKFPGLTKVKKPDSSVLYYCSICYRTSEKSGICARHGFPNTLKKGRVAHLEVYHRKNKRYESDEDAFNA